MSQNVDPTHPIRGGCIKKVEKYDMTKILQRHSRPGVKYFVGVLEGANVNSFLHAGAINRLVPQIAKELGETDVKLK